MMSIAACFGVFGLTSATSATAAIPYVTHANRASSKSENNVIRVTRFVYTNAQGQVLSSSIEWDYKNALRSEDFTVNGDLRKEEFGTFGTKSSVTDTAGQNLVGKGINFFNHTWEPNPSFGLPPASISQIETTDRSRIASRQYRVIGYPLLRGVHTIEFSCSISDCGEFDQSPSFTEWVNRSTYLPLQNIESRSFGEDYSETFNYLAPTVSNLKLLKSVVPSGYKNCRALPTNALTLAQCVIAY
jgi:hypothetical protein